jgi:hypothetical protein
MALQWVQEAILSAETVPWLTTTSQDPNPEQVVGKGVDPHAASGLLFGLGVNNLISLSSLRMPILARVATCQYR